MTPQEENHQGNNYMAAPMHQYGSSILYLTNPQDEIFKMEAAFRNIGVDKDGNTQKYGKPLMNDIGISAVIGLVQAVVNQNTNMSDLDKWEIPSHIMFLADTLARDLMTNRLKYGIESPSDRDKIYYQALSTAHITLKRPFSGGERRFWKGSTQEVTHNVQQNKQQGSLFKLNPWSK